MLLLINSQGYFSFHAAFVHYSQHHHSHNGSNSHQAERSKDDSNGNGPTCWQTRWRNKWRGRGGDSYRTGSKVLLGGRKEYAGTDKEAHWLALCMNKQSYYVCLLQPLEQPNMNHVNHSPSKCLQRQDRWWQYQIPLLEQLPESMELDDSISKHIHATCTTVSHCMLLLFFVFTG